MALQLDLSIDRLSNSNTLQYHYVSEFGCVSFLRKKRCPFFIGMNVRVFKSASCNVLDMGPMELKKKCWCRGLKLITADRLILVKSQQFSQLYPVVL